MIQTFLESGRSGFYIRVLKEGTVEAGDVITRVRTNPNEETINSIVQGIKKAEPDT